MEGSLVLGIDAGSANTAAVLADLAGGSPQIIGVGLVPSNGVRRGMVVDLTAAAESIRAAVAQATGMAGRGGEAAAVASVNGTHIQSVIWSAEVPVHRPSAGVTPEDVRRALDEAAVVELAAGREVIHVLPRAYRLDQADGVANPLGLAGRRLGVEAHLITAESLPRQNYLEAMRQAGLNVADFQLGIRAAGDVVLTREEREAGVLLLDIGAGTTGVAVYDRGHLWYVSVLPVGGEHITADLAALLQIPVSSAEQLKIERGWAAAEQAPDTGFELVSPSGKSAREVTDKQVAQIIESRVLEILQLAAGQVKRSGYAGLFPGGLVLTGGTARLKGLAPLAADCLGLPARTGAPEGVLVNGPEFATAVGLVQWGARLAQDEAAAAARAAEQNRSARIKNWLRSLFG
ncbi:MAG TPA: cell division protein FtsA [Symbiobacteriaceae bacterium]|nr:cell division protein FtsA [Symbiobacteriaceae bacterium]